MLFQLQTKLQLIIGSTFSKKMGPMLKRINGVYLDHRVAALCLLSDLFQLWQTNPAKADYACIKLLRIAILLMWHLELKCNGSGLQNANLQKGVSATTERKESHEQCLPNKCHCDDWIQQNVDKKIKINHQHKVLTCAMDVYVTDCTM